MTDSDWARRATTCPALISLPVSQSRIRDVGKRSRWRPCDGQSGLADKFERRAPFHSDARRQKIPSQWREEGQALCRLRENRGENVSVAVCSRKRSPLAIFLTIATRSQQDLPGSFVATSPVDRSRNQSLLRTEYSEYSRPKEWDQEQLRASSCSLVQLHYRTTDLRSHWRHDPGTS